MGWNNFFILKKAKSLYDKIGTVSELRKELHRTNNHR